jgi:hypothetical protein
MLGPVYEKLKAQSKIPLRTPKPCCFPYSTQRTKNDLTDTRL